MQSTAKCSCEKISITLKGKPQIVLVCNCYDCQKRTGSVFGVSAYYNQAQVLNTQGETKTFTRIGESGEKIETHFCPTCGSSLYWYADLLSGMISVAPGCFQAPNFPAPTKVVYNKHKHHWVVFPEEWKVFESSSIKKST